MYRNLIVSIRQLLKITLARVSKNQPLRASERPSNKTIKPFISVGRMIGDPDSPDERTRQEVAAMKYRLEMFKLRNEFYEIDNL